MIQVVAVVGPTASGKTDFALALAEKIGTEIISADSMQFYRGLGIGTGQPSADQLERVPHHFINSLDLSEHVSAGWFRERACEIVQRLNAGGRPAVVVGGSGLYVRALIDGLFVSPPQDDALRAALETEADRIGSSGLHARLAKCDPASARRIEPNDLKRIVRAMEVFEITGQPMSELHETDDLKHETLSACQLGLQWPRDQLYERINRRVDAMIDCGWLEEVRALLEAGCLDHLARLRPIGFLELASVVQGMRELQDAVDEIKMNTRRYAKRQLTWFRKDGRIKWLPGSAADEGVLQPEHIEDIAALFPR